MTFIPKVGIVSCSGEACSGGNISRAATLRVLHHLCPTETVTICLPLFLAGEESEREFARKFPTITVDGCGKMCAAKGTTKYSSDPAVKINLEDYLGSSCVESNERWRIDGHVDVVDRVAQDIAAHVDHLREEWE